LIVSAAERPAPLLHRAVIGRTSDELILAPACAIQSRSVQKCANLRASVRGVRLSRTSASPPKGGHHVRPYRDFRYSTRSRFCSAVRFKPKTRS
jgi:hypothetical protein